MLTMCHNRLCYLIFVCFFFKQKTAYEMRISDWSSDVCSSDLIAVRSSTHPVDEGTDEGPCHQPDGDNRQDDSRADIAAPLVRCRHVFLLSQIGRAHV